MMAKHRKPSKTKQNIKRATVATGGAVVALNVTTMTPALAEAPVEVKPYTYLDVAAPLALPQAPVAAPVIIPGGERVVNKAREYFGVGYAWGGEDRGGMDCSGLVFRVFQDLGVELPRTSRAMASVGTAVGSLAEAQAGDLLTFDSDGDGVVNHVGIYVSPGRMIDSANFGEVVQERNIWGTPVAIRRVSVDGEEAAPAPVEPQATPQASNYTVIAGDWLSAIAPKVGVTDWHTLYEQNKDVIGDNPNMIFPGQVFFVGGLPLPQAPVTVEEAPVQSGTVVPGATFTSEYGPRWGTMHSGIDLAAPIGTPIFAAEAGTVITAEAKDNGFGQWVRVQGVDGTITVYGHVDSWTVDVGQWVEAGQQIATVGDRGDSTGPHLHFEVHIGPGPVNPEPWLNDRGIYVR